MKKILLMLPVLALASCTAPDGTTGPAAGSEETKPVQRRSRFGPGAGYATGVGHYEQTSEPVTVENPAKKPKPAAAPAAVAASQKVPQAPPLAPTVAPAQRKPFFSFLMKKEPPKALVVKTTPTPKKSTQAPKARDTPVELPKQDDGGLRLPDMLTMPEKNEFESTNPSATKPQGSGAVIARPPTDPPVRPKTKETP